MANTPLHQDQTSMQICSFYEKFYNSLVMFYKFKTLKSIIHYNLINTQNIKKSFSLLVKVLYCKSFITKPTSYKNANEHTVSHLSIVSAIHIHMHNRNVNKIVRIAFTKIT